MNCVEEVSFEDLGNGTDQEVPCGEIFRLVLGRVRLQCDCDLLIDEEYSV